MRKRWVASAAVAALFCLGSIGPAVAVSDGNYRSDRVSEPAVRLNQGGLGIFTLGLGGWQVQSSAIAVQDGSQISSPGFATAGWLRVKPDDAGAPGTEIGALLQNGACPDVFYSDNMMKCFGFLTPVLPQSGVPRPSAPRFSVPCWFRTDFVAPLQPGQHATLIVNGVVGQADVWVNGHEVATQATVQGAYTRYSFDINVSVRAGDNVLALEVYPNDPARMYTVDDVDWNQVPPDNKTGIQFPIQLHISNALELSNSHVLQNNPPDLSSSALSVKADITNHSETAQTGALSASITPPGSTAAAIRVYQQVSVPAHATKTAVFAPPAYPQLTLSHPQIWWPYQMGSQPLYQLSVSLAQGRLPPETQSETFGIRTLTTYLVGKAPMAPEGVRVFAINGSPFVVRGGGWTPDLFLRYSSTDIANQIDLLKNLGLNLIRLEGHQMPDDFYQQMDAAGIMVDGGFQCCDGWAPLAGDTGLSAHDYAIMELSAYTIGQQLRNHPSVINYSWSDNAPTPRQEQVSLRGFARADFQEPLICSAGYTSPEYNSCQVLPPSGEREGPYDWVPAVYWYDNSHSNSFDFTRTDAGGSWGFASEQSAGDTVPTVDSIRRFLSASDQAELWLNPAYNQYHTNYEPDNVSYQFGTLYSLDQAIRNRHGIWSSLAQYVEEAQVENYEDTRAQFEAFIDHSTNRPTPSTGTIYWMVNKGWPTLLWDLYNHDYDQAGSYFGAKKANETLHVLYALDSGGVTVDNLSGATHSELSVVSRVYDTAGVLLDQQQVSGISLPSQGVANDVIRPRVPSPTTPPAPARTYFIELLLYGSGSIVDRNVYWQSTQQDVIDSPTTYTPLTPRATMVQYADLTALQHLPVASVTASATTLSGGTGTATTRVTITITNTSPGRTVAFFLRADVRRGTPDGHELPGDNQVLPVMWSDNDITLWPGESETVTASYETSLLHGATPVVSISGWNVTSFDVIAASPGPLVSVPASAIPPASSRSIPNTAGGRDAGAGLAGATLVAIAARARLRRRRD